MPEVNMTICVSRRLFRRLIFTDIDDAMKLPETSLVRRVREMTRDERSARFVGVDVLPIMIGSNKSIEAIVVHGRVADEVLEGPGLIDSDDHL